MNSKLQSLKLIHPVRVSFLAIFYICKPTIISYDQKNICGCSINFIKLLALKSDFIYIRDYLLYVYINSVNVYLRIYLPHFQRLITLF